MERRKFLSVMVAVAVATAYSASAEDKQGEKKGGDKPQDYGGGGASKPGDYPKGGGGDKKRPAAR